jgi:hypothetical protein
VRELYLLRIELQRYKPLQARHDKIREMLLALKMSGRNEPMIWNGVTVDFVPKQKSGYTVADRIEQHISITGNPIQAVTD